eukprot:m.438792 g.438792  ORF g.438792 m.438792 type:complete len:314 (-) comp21446_c0_seq1:3542-4483(-)
MAADAKKFCNRGWSRRKTDTTRASATFPGVGTVRCKVAQWRLYARCPQSLVGWNAESNRIHRGSAGAAALVALCDAIKCSTTGSMFIALHASSACAFGGHPSTAAGKTLSSASAAAAITAASVRVMLSLHADSTGPLRRKSTEGKSGGPDVPPQACPGPSLEETVPSAKCSGRTPSMNDSMPTVGLQLSSRDAAETASVGTRPNAMDAGDCPTHRSELPGTERPWQMATTWRRRTLSSRASTEGPGANSTPLACWLDICRLGVGNLGSAVQKLSNPGVYDNVDGPLPAASAVQEASSVSSTTSSSNSVSSVSS